MTSQYAKHRSTREKVVVQVYHAGDHVDPKLQPNHGDYIVYCNDGRALVLSPDRFAQDYEITGPC